MYIKIIAWLWIVLGILFLVFPQLLKKRFQKKSFKKVKKILFLIVLFLAFTLLSLSFKISGILPKIIAVLAILGIFKVLSIVKGKTSERLSQWFEKKPLTLFRA
ncbi:MAG: hypothetical protein KKH25_00530, partial [Candidatus Omnitrophica bacterium]|nr:hypothetical protein [Candidatus Omnitrophota bacterium]